MSSGTPTRTEHVYNQIRQWIVNGEMHRGDKLPSHLDLAARFDVAPMTVRTALTRLEQDGFVVREHGRGTFVRETGGSTVLVVDDDPVSRGVLSAQVTRCGFPCIQASSAIEATEILGGDRSIALILSDVYMPDRATGMKFIEDAHKRWPDLPLAAVTGYPDDLAGLHGTAAQPFLVLSKPVREERIEALLSLVLAPAGAGKSGPERGDVHGPTLAADRLRQAIVRALRHGQVLAVVHVEVAQADSGRLASADAEGILRDSLRESDTFTRLTENRFEMLLHDIGSRDNVTTVGRKLLGALLTCPAHAKVSIGIGLFPFDGQDAFVLQGCADAALRLAVVHPDSRFEFFFREAPTV